jgi:hypothetical protein
MANDFSYEVTEEIGVIGNPTPSGWTTQLNLVSWNGKEPKLDIRSWNEDLSRMGKGISLSMEEATELANLLNSYLRLGSEEDFERPLTKEEMLAEMASMMPEEATE